MEKKNKKKNKNTTRSKTVTVKAAKGNKLNNKATENRKGIKRRKRTAGNKSTQHSRPTIKGRGGYIVYSIPLYSLRQVVVVVVCLLCVCVYTEDETGRSGPAGQTILKGSIHQSSIYRVVVVSVRFLTSFPLPPFLSLSLCMCVCIQGSCPYKHTHTHRHTYTHKQEMVYRESVYMQTLSDFGCGLDERNVVLFPCQIRNTGVACA